MSRRPAVLALALASALLFGCKDSSGPSTTFPAFSAQVVATYCIRGDRAPTQAIAGTLASGDCRLTDSSYYEIWRIRVPVAGAYQFAATSAFDNLLAILKVESFNDSLATLSFVASDDDSGPDSNALMVGVTLEPNVDYFLLANGFDSTDVGPYTITFTSP